MNFFSVETMLKIKRDDHERAAQKALLEYEVKLVHQDAPPNQHRVLRFAHYLGLLSPRRRFRRAR